MISISLDGELQLTELVYGKISLRNIRVPSILRYADWVNANLDADLEVET
jgi:hypothetical protein